MLWNLVKMSWSETKEQRLPIIHLVLTDVYHRNWRQCLRVLLLMITWKLNESENYCSCQVYKVSHKDAYALTLEEEGEEKKRLRNPLKCCNSLTFPTANNAASF